MPEDQNIFAPERYLVILKRVYRTVACRLNATIAFVSNPEGHVLSTKPSPAKQETDNPSNESTFINRF